MPFTIFSTKSHSYLYDRPENKVVEIDKEMYDALKGKQGNEIRQAAISKMQAKGLCMDNSIETIEHPFTKDIELHLNGRMEQVALQVTQNCNLRCEYCVYSGKYNNRTHSNRRMDLSVALSAVDFLMEHSYLSDRVVIGFYGGEPLLEIELIHKVVEYVKAKYSTKAVRLAIKTNATLLTEEVAEYFDQNHFIVMVSLDGPKDLHNKHRCFIDGHGSFDLVIRNLENIQKNHPDLYATMSTNTVLSPDIDFKSVEDFLIKDNIIGKLNSKVSLLSDTGLDEKIKFDEKTAAYQQAGEVAQMLGMIGEVEVPEQYLIMGDYQTTLKETYDGLTIGNYKVKSAAPSGPCIVGTSRSFCDVNGRLFPCEKVNESKEMCIGNIFEGFDIEAVRRILNIAQTTEAECKKCWAFPFCTACVAASLGGNGLSRKKRLSKCANIRHAAQERLRNVMILQEYGYDFNQYDIQKGE